MSSPREIMRAKSKDHYAVNNAHDLKALSGGVAVITGGNTAPLSPARRRASLVMLRFRALC